MQTYPTSSVTSGAFLFGQSTCAAALYLDVAFSLLLSVGCYLLFSAKLARCRGAATVTQFGGVHLPSTTISVH